MYRLRGLVAYVHGDYCKDRGQHVRAGHRQTIFDLSQCRDSFAQGGVTMRDSSIGRAGFDRVLMAVAATFLTVSATSALAQSSASRSAAELAIEAAIPVPQPANVAPPTADDFKMDATASVAPKQIE